MPDNIFKENVPYEVVLTTMDRDNRTNVAAIGVMRSGDIYNLRIFAGSNTFENIKTMKMFGINIVHGIDTIAKSALKGWGSKEHEIDDDEFEDHEGFPFLKEATAYIECEVLEWMEQEGSDQFGPYRIAFVKGRATNSKMKEPKEALKRQDQPLVDALVMATRWKLADGISKKRLEKVIRQLMEKSVANFDEKTFEAVGILESFLAGSGEKNLEELFRE